MPNNNPVFVFDGKLCKFEGMTKEQIINAIAEATGVTPSDVDEGFISTIVEQNNSKSVHFWFGSQAEYNALETYDSDTFYIIDGDATIDDLEAGVQNADTEIDEVRADIQELDEGKADVTDLNAAVADIQAIQNTLTFSGGGTGLAGFSLAKQVSDSSVLSNNPLPSAGLYVLVSRASYQLGRDTYTSIIVYFDGVHKARTALFNQQYYDPDTSSFPVDVADILIDASGYTTLIPKFGQTKMLLYYEIHYRKIG